MGICGICGNITSDKCTTCQKCANNSEVSDEKAYSYNYNDNDVVDKQKLSKFINVAKYIINKLRASIPARDAVSDKKTLNIFGRLLFLIMCVITITLAIFCGFKAFEQNKIVKLGKENNVIGLQAYLIDKQYQNNLSIKTTVVNTLIKINTEESANLLADAFLMNASILDENDKKYIYKQLTESKIKNDKLAKSIIKGNNATRNYKIADDGINYVLKVYSIQEIFYMLRDKYLNTQLSADEQSIKNLIAIMSADKQFIDFINSWEIGALSNALNRYSETLASRNDVKNKLATVNNSISSNSSIIYKTFTQIHRDFMNIYRLVLVDKYAGLMTRAAMESNISFIDEEIKRSANFWRNLSIERGLMVYYSAVWNISGEADQKYLMRIGNAAIQAAYELERLNKQREDLDSELSRYNDILTRNWENQGVLQALENLKNAIT